MGSWMETGVGVGSQEQVCRGEASSDQGLGALQGFSGRGESEIAGKQGESGGEHVGIPEAAWEGKDGDGVVVQSKEAASRGTPANVWHSTTGQLCPRLGAEPARCIVSCLEYRPRVSQSSAWGRQNLVSGDL